MVIKRLLFFILMVFTCTAVFSGCAKTPPQTSVSQAPSCRDALSGDLQNLSSNDVARLLDEALENRDIADCWIPLVKESLDSRIDIPDAHLARAVHEFNRHEMEAYFHKSIFRYYSAVNRENKRYRKAEKELLVAYCRYVLANAESANDPNVQNAQLLTRRLDPDLHDKIFR